MSVYCRWVCILWVVCGFGRAMAAQATSLPRGHVFYQSDFAGVGLGGLVGNGVLEPGPAGKCLAVQTTANAPAMSRISLPAEQMRGYTVYCSAMVKAEGISDKPNTWNGIKVMMPIQTKQGPIWPQAAIGVGSFDWKKVTFAVRVPDDATSAVLMLGLEQVSGKVWFDQVKISVRKAPVAPLPPADPAKPYVQTTQRRGAMIQSGIDRASLRVLGQEWNANLIRWQMTSQPVAGKARALDQYDQWLEEQLKKLDAALPSCQEYGLQVVLDMHSPPGGAPINGGYIAANAGLFTDKAAQAKFIQAWQKMALRYKGNKLIWGFDLVNEPVEEATDEDVDDWHDLAQKAGHAIRAIDPDRTLIVEPPDWGGPRGLIGFAPIDLPNVVYSVHMYLPHTFTHQGVYEQKQPLNYPGLIQGKQWDKSALAEQLRPVVAFQQAYRVPIYIGEFSVIRWAPGDSGHRYLKDVIDIFEENGWDWSYHAFREWSGWSVEHGPDRANTKPTADPTDRQKLLRQWYAKNVKPAGQR